MTFKHEKISLFSSRSNDDCCNESLIGSLIATLKERGCNNMCIELIGSDIDIREYAKW